jgi:hypothetical protein
VSLEAALLDELLGQHIAGREENLCNYISNHPPEFCCARFVVLQCSWTVEVIGMLSWRGCDKENRQAQSRMRLRIASIVHTAVVMLCVNSGALLSFAWYLHQFNQRRSHCKQLPRYIATHHRNAMVSVCLAEQV